MKNNPILISLFLAIHISIFSCTTNTSKQEIEEAAKHVGRNNGAYYTIVEFQKGTSALTHQSKDELKEFIRKASQDRSKLSEIKILVWADRDYSSLKLKPKQSDVKIIDDRTKSIENYLKETLKMSTGFLSYNMIKSPDKMKELISPDSSMTKKVFEKTGSPPTLEGGDLASLMDNKIGKALIMVNYE